MPLSAPPVERELLHTREIALRGYERADGMFDIEAHLVDTKTYGFDNFDRGRVEAGEPLHGMWMRLTIDEDMVIRACEASTDFAPFAICAEAAPNFARLEGIRIGPGFNRAVKERVGGTAGCTHLRELLGQMATTAFQSLYRVRERRRREAEASGHKPRSSPVVGTCHAYAPDSPVVRRLWPEAAKPHR